MSAIGPSARAEGHGQRPPPPLYDYRVDKPGFITPPPGLIPSRPTETSETVRLTERRPNLPVFVPAGPGGPVPPAAPKPAVDESTVQPPPRGPEVEATAEPAAPQTAAQPPRPQERTSAPPQWSLTLHDGSVIHVSGTLLLGRDPGRVESWESASLVRINDPEKSVSKTHAAIDCSGDELWVTDLHSTNGVAVYDPSGGEIVLEPGARLSVTPGATLELGRYRIQVYRQ